MNVNQDAFVLTHVNLYLGPTHALKNISLNIPRGKWSSIVGPNGAGKSSLLSVLAGLAVLPASPGVGIHVLGHAMLALKPRKRASLISWLGQQQDVRSDMPVFDVVMLGRMPHQPWLSSPSAQDRAIVIQALESVQALGWRDRPMHQLSVGEQQRVLIARALAVGAEILLMDEPLNSLDPPHQADWLKLMKTLVSQGKTVVSVLHEISMALHADEMIVMDQGQVKYQGLSRDSTTHRTIEHTFNDRIKIYSFMDSWVVLPK